MLPLEALRPEDSLARVVSAMHSRCRVSRSAAAAWERSGAPGCSLWIAYTSQTPQDVEPGLDAAALRSARELLTSFSAAVGGMPLAIVSANPLLPCNNAAQYVHKRSQMTRPGYTRPL